MKFQQTSGGSGSGRRRRRSGYMPLSEINVTPFVDVMLVLLIVFMVAAPLLTVGVNVDLPKTRASVIQDQDEPLVVSIKNNGHVYVQETQVELDQLIGLLLSVSKNNMETKIYIKGDQKLSYGEIMQVMGRVSAAGFSKVALIADHPDFKK